MAQNSNFDLKSSDAAFQDQFQSTQPAKRNEKEVSALTVAEPLAREDEGIRAANKVPFEWNVGDKIQDLYEVKGVHRGLVTSVSISADGRWALSRDFSRKDEDVETCRDHEFPPTLKCYKGARVNLENFL